MPPFAEKIANAKKKVQKKIAAQVKSMPAHMPIESLTLERGYIRNADDTECQQIPRMTPNSSGVVLMHYEEAKQWLEKTLVLSQDELALVVIGECKHHDKSKCNRLQLPVNISGEPLLLQACLHQMGAKMTKFASDGDDEIPITDTHVVSFTAGREDLTNEDWEILIHSPVKHMMKLLGDDVSEVAFVSPPWGRSFQHQGKRCLHSMPVQYNSMHVSR